MATMSKDHANFQNLVCLIYISLLNCAMIMKISLNWVDLI